MPPQTRKGGRLWRYVSPARQFDETRAEFNDSLSPGQCFTQNIAGNPGLRGSKGGLEGVKRHPRAGQAPP